MTTPEVVLADQLLEPWRRRKRGIEVLVFPVAGPTLFDLAFEARQRQCRIAEHRHVEVISGLVLGPSDEVLFALHERPSANASMRVTS